MKEYANWQTVGFIVQTTATNDNSSLNTKPIYQLNSSKFTHHQKHKFISLRHCICSR